MHARAIPRFSRPLAVACSSRSWAAVYSTVSSIPSSLDLSTTLEPVYEKANKHDGAQEVNVDVPTSEGPRRKPFKPLEGNSMKPAPADGKYSLDSLGVVVEAGTAVDGTFKPLKDANKWRRSHVPRLAHGLEKVLSKRGVHWLQDPITKKYNFNEALQTIPQPHQFAFERLPEFVPSSQDAHLILYARKTNSKYVGSTSSLTGILSQIYLALSEEKLVSLTNLGTEFTSAPRFFTPGQRIPVSVVLNYQDGIYTTDADKERDEDNTEIILLSMGTLLEKFLTLPQHVFKRFLKSHTQADHPILKDVHRYAKHGKFLMRSQLDCVDDSLPGTGIFDLKTRAISPIRHDVHNYLKYLGVFLTSLTGRYGSFEAEYYDMIRAAFLEYSFQARIGNMDGIMVAYHNTARIFGFQYVSLKEMDLCLFGKEGAGTKVFQRCVWIMEMLYKNITQCFPEQSVKATFEKRNKALYVWVEPVQNPNPDAMPPVVELKLSLTNIVHGKACRGPYAVFSNSEPWALQYKLERFDQPLESIYARRGRAYKRQMSIAKSFPHTVEMPSDDPDSQI